MVRMTKYLVFQVSARICTRLAASGPLITSPFPRSSQSPEATVGVAIGSPKGCGTDRPAAICIPEMGAAIGAPKGCAVLAHPPCCRMHF